MKANIVEAAKPAKLRLADAPINKLLKYENSESGQRIFYLKLPKGVWMRFEGGSIEVHLDNYMNVFVKEMPAGSSIEFISE
jgi:hypothetical protein